MTTTPSQGATLSIDPQFLLPLIRQVATEAVTALQEEHVRLGDKLAYSEQEAARLLGLNYHQLRDERRRGKISASVVVGRRIRYTRADLQAYLAARRVNQAS
jgi:excisionase family DNA binding protein